MPTFSSPILPNASGLALGSASQPWAMFATSVSFQSLLSLSVNAASAGLLRLANTDLIEWRNAANGGNLTLGPSGVAAAPFDSDLLTYSGNGFKGAEFVSPTLPATTGLLRLSDAETISWRNHANSGNISIVHNTDDSLTLPAVIAAATSVTTATLAATSQVNTPLVIPSGTSGTALALKSSAGSAGVNGGTTSVVGGAGGTGVTTGGSVTISGGSGGSVGGSVVITAGSGPDVNGFVVLNSGTGVGTNTKFITYNNISLVGGGLASEIAAVDLTAQTAAITTTPLYAVPSTGQGQYRLSWNAKVTTVAGTSSTLGPLTVVYTDPDGISPTITCAAIIAAGTVATSSAGNTTGSVLLGTSMLLNCKASTNVTYAFGYASVAASIMAFNLHIRLEAL